MASTTIDSVPLPEVKARTIVAHRTHARNSLNFATIVTWAWALAGLIGAVVVGMIEVEDDGLYATSNTRPFVGLLYSASGSRC